MPQSVRRHQHLHFCSEFLGLPVQTHRGPLVQEYLSGLHDVLFRCLDDYSRVLVVRFDLHLPDGAYVPDNETMERFKASLQAKLVHTQSRRRREGIRIHETRVRLFWCRELSKENRVHFHCAVMLNGHAFAGVGKFDPQADNLYARIHQAWASAHDIPSARGLVHVPRRGVYNVTRDARRSHDEVFRRLSYLCKAETKDYGERRHACGWSRG